MWEQLDEVIGKLVTFLVALWDLLCNHWLFAVNLSLTTCHYTILHYIYLLYEKFEQEMGLLQVSVHHLQKNLCAPRRRGHISLLFKSANRAVSGCLVQ